MQAELFPLDKLKQKYHSNYLNAYNKLNPRQKEAVDTIEGPVLVNAGPGTGKTQILATRLGKILHEQDVQPYNILCLTYTDSATISMRKRLVEIIGPTAHQIHISTFHSFCNQVIKENLEYFGEYRQLDAISDLERIDVYNQIIDNLPDDNILKRYKGNIYFESKRLRNLFDIMQKENYSSDEVKEMIQNFLQEQKEDEKFICKRKSVNKKTGRTYMKGDFRDDHYEKLVKKFDPLIAAVDQYENYKNIMSEKERYDYNDMILWVIQAFAENEEILLRYQERYLYFLVDEYQDTNGAQNELLTHLISYWDRPNVFVVGDDDQAIYKFQGANLGNIFSFKNKYNPKTIVLEENYRSNQAILDQSMMLIQLNTERMVRQDASLTKELKASGDHKDDQTVPEIRCYDKVSAEYAHLAYELEETYKDPNQSLKDVAVIYRKHRQVDDLVTVLEKRNVPINVRRRINILELPFIKNIINILQYIEEEYELYGLGEGRLFEILHYNYFNNDCLDVGRISGYISRINTQRPSKSEAKETVERKKWRDIITDEEVLNNLSLNNKEQILKSALTLEHWIQQVPIITIQTLFEKVLNDGGILQYIMNQSNKSWLLQLVTTLFDFIKNEAEKKSDCDLTYILDTIKKMNDNDVPLPVNKTISSEDGVHFITAHSAKGAEYKKVYILSAIQSVWDKNNSTYGHYSYPEGFNADNATNTEDERRLFYVAMTRAKTDLIISYSQYSEQKKEQEKSAFVEEILAQSDQEIIKMKVSDDLIADFYYNLLRTHKKRIELVEKDLIDQWLDGYRMSVTHLNKYIRCPLSFYFEVILRVPHARNAYSGYGSAMHNALYRFFLYLKHNEDHSADKLIFYFVESMKHYRSNFTQQEFENLTKLGSKSLEALYEEKIESWANLNKFAVEENISHAQYKGVPLKGVIDKIEILDGHVNVVDYKTGDFTKQKTKEKLRPSSEKIPEGGDYWRQIVFYKILLDSDKKSQWNMLSGEIEFIEHNKKTESFMTEKFVVQDQDIDFIGTQITDTYKNIKNYNFDKTCEDEECMWCQFVHNNYTLSDELKDDIYENE